MSQRRSGVLPLLLVVVLGAGAAGAFVALRGSSGPALRVGASVPGLRLPRLGGEFISLGDLRGRVVFVNFWATWCAPCREEAPSMQRLYSKLRDEPFEMIAISIDASDAQPAVEEFRDEFDLTFPILLDSDKRSYDEYQAYGVPESFLIDAEGRLAERFIGPKNWDDPRYLRAIRRLISRSGESAKTSSPSPEVRGG